MAENEQLKQLEIKNINSTDLYKQLLDESNQLIQISTYPEMTMIYANKPACSFTANAGKPYIGQKCYSFMMGLPEQCPFCPLRNIGSNNSYITEVDNGKQVFSVKTSILVLDGKKVFVEFATDVTTVRRAQQLYASRLQTLIDIIPDAQGIFHLNLTQNKWISTNGVSKSVKQLQNLPDVNTTIREIAKFVPDPQGEKALYDTYCLSSLLKAYNLGRAEISSDTKSYYDDGSIRWTRMLARLITNPTTGDLECLIFGLDISDEKLLQEKMTRVEEENKYILEKSKRDMLTGIYCKSAFEELANEYILKNPNESFAVIFLDLDNFKNINDTLGHFMGDRAIIDTAAKLENQFANKDIISRFGGDEFCVLLKDIPTDTLKDKLAFLLKKLSATYEEEGRAVSITASMGVAQACGPVTSIRNILELADQALYLAKDKGGNTYVLTDYVEK